MKILILSDINSAHTQKWAIALAKEGLQIGIFSLSAPMQDWYSMHNIILLNSDSLNKTVSNSGVFSKLFYLKNVPVLKSILHYFKPDIVHAHYATSYGLIGVLSNFKPIIVSAWGSDLMEFPKKSILHKNLLKFILNRSTLLIVTSSVLENSAKKLTNKEITKIPFGIDLDYFKPKKVKLFFGEDDIIIGTIKSLETIYGIDTLIKAFSVLMKKDRNKKMKLLIVGGGSKDIEYKQLAKDLGVFDYTMFTGKIPYEQISDYHNTIDIFVNISRNESFGVAALEAAACEKPVILTNVGGLLEVAIKNITAKFIEVDNVTQTVEAIEYFLDENNRKKLGAEGRAFVKLNYDFKNNLVQQLNLYKLFTNLN